MIVSILLDYGIPKVVETENDISGGDDVITFLVGD